MEYAQLDVEIETIFRGLDITDRKSTLLTTEAVLELYEEYVAGVSFGPHAGEMSKFAEQHTKRIRGILYNLKKRELSKKDNRYFFQLDKEDSGYLFQMYKNLFLTYAPKENLPELSGLFKKAGSFSQFTELLNKKVGSITSELVAIVDEQKPLGPKTKEFKSMLGSLNLSLSFLKRGSASGSFVPVFGSLGYAHINVPQNVLKTTANLVFYVIGLFFLIRGIVLLKEAVRSEEEDWLRPIIYICAGLLWILVGMK